MENTRIGPSIFQRIKSQTTNAMSCRSNEEIEIRDSIVEHLHKLLNVRHGNVTTSPDYGLPDFNDIAHSDTNVVTMISHAIRECIEKYEPRLSNVRVLPADDNMGIASCFKFDVTAHLNQSHPVTEVWFETILDIDGKAIVVRR